MDTCKQLQDFEDVVVDSLEAELERRKQRLERARAELQKRFVAFADEQACVAALEKALAKAHHLL